MNKKIGNPINSELSKVSQKIKKTNNKELEKKYTGSICVKDPDKVQNAAMSKELNYYRKFFEISLDPYITIGPDGMITDANTASENVTGLAKEKLIGTDFSIYVTAPQKAKAGFQQVMSDGVLVGYELNLKHLNGTTTPVLFNASVYNDSAGRIVGVFAAARDITATRKAEEELIYLKTNLEQLVKQRADDLIIVNKELAFQSEEKADRAAELIIADKELAFQSEEKADRAAELVIANEELTFQNEEKEKRAAELIIANKELAFQNEEKDKRAAELENANRKLALQQKKIKEFNNQLEYRVIERTEQLESLNKELEAFSYSISHDLKAPLRHIAGYVSLLMKKYGTLFPEEGKHYLEMISFSVENMGELIEALLHFSRSGRIEMNKKFLNMNEIVDVLIQPIREQEIDRRIEFIIEPMHLAFGDLEMIKSVWSNLIENAVKFSRKKEFTKIVIGANEEKNETVYFIKDNGVGFDMNYASKLFTVFQRLHLRKDYEGTGIGLANVQRIITRHGGKIWAESKVGEGSTFYFSLINRRESENTWK